MRALTSFRPHGPRIGLFVVCLLMFAGCVIEPSDSIWKPQDGIVKLWGFAPGPSGAVSVEALNSSNGWEVVASGTTTARLTYTGSRSGYYWTLSVNINTMPARFKVAGRVKLRAKAGTWFMPTHSDAQTKARVADTNPLVEVWNAYVSPSSNQNIISVWL